jgi:uncharacterized protein (TIGR03435 family)
MNYKLILIICAAMMATIVAAQQQQLSPAGSPDDPRFTKFVYDVVSIKPVKIDPNAPGTWRGMPESPDGLQIHNLPLNLVIDRAFGANHPLPQVKGGPVWIRDDLYEINAKMGSEVAESLAALSKMDQKLARKHMLQTLLRDYFKVQVHIETSEVPIFALTIAKGGLKMQASKDSDPKAGHMNVSFLNGNEIWTATSFGLQNLLPQMTSEAGRPVFDQTGLTGIYDFKLTFVSDRQGPATNPSAAASGLDVAPPLNVALEEQLGLKLTATKGPMDVVVVDQIERPAEN